MPGSRSQTSTKSTRLTALSNWGKSHSTDWHREIEQATAQYRAPNVGHDTRQYFPLDQLRYHTDDYLHKKGRNLTSDQIDTRLTALVKAHPAKDVAIVACAHALSANAVKSLLRGELQVGLNSNIGLLTFLRVIIALGPSNADAVQPLEVQCAEILISLSSPDILTIGRDLQIYIALLAGGYRSDLLLHSSFDAIPRNACIDFAEQLEIMRLSKQWESARVASEWLTRLPGTSPMTEELLDASFPDWYIWAAWRPDKSRLSLWEHLPVEKREELSDILQLEGPDFISGRKATLREGLMPKGNHRAGFSIRHGQFRVRLENNSEADAHDMLDRLLDTLHRAHLVSASAVSLFKHMCLRNTANDRELQTLELIIETGDSTVVTAVLDMFTSEANIARMKAAMRLLRALGQPNVQALRETLSSRVIHIVEETILSMQNKFCEQLQNGRPVDGLGMRLHALVQSLQNSPWVQPMLSDGLRSLLSRWPVAENVKALFTLRIDAQRASLKGSSELTKMVDEYCMSCLAGRGIVSERTRNIMDGLIHLWRQPPDSDRRAAGLTLAKRSTIPFPLLRRCLIGLCDMSDRFVSRVSLMISKDTDIACVNFARLLVSQRLVNSPRIECWRDLLQSMIQQRGSTLLECTVTEFGVESLSVWVDDLRKIFGDGVQGSFPILGGPFLRWTERLLVNYRAVLTRFENSVGHMRWILMGWEESETIIPFLDVLKEPEQGLYQPVVEAMLALLAPDGGNSRRICKVVVLLARTTTHGTRACLRVLEVHQKSSEQIAEVVLTGWLRSAEMTQADKRALEEMAATLNIRVHANHNPSEANFQAASDYLDSEYSSIIEEAARLESVRLTLKAHDTRRTSRLLATLNIEDPSMIEDAVSGIPLSLVDVVEKIGDKEFELFFPLTHLKEFQRTALGFGNARSLLVRLRSTNPPEFCVHLYPAPYSSVAAGHASAALSEGTGGHRYWTASAGGSPPDSHFCHDGANRATYQVSRALFQHLIRDSASLEAVHRMLVTAVDKLGNFCTVCGEDFGIRLWRSTTCTEKCSIALRRASLEVCLIDLRNDPPVVNLLLTAVHAAANSHLDLSTLLPGCPITDKTKLLQALNTTPAPSTLQDVHNLTASVKRLGSSTESLLSWVCTSYRGSLASATGTLKIPSMPGVHQFVLPNTFPELEKRFAVHLQAQQPTRVVFHGTSLDRLYIILRQGLVICRTGPLQAHGAAYGEGIYAADDLPTALNFTAGGRNTLSPGWHASAFPNVRVVLGCELAGTGNNPSAPRGMWVVTDESRILVRYVFLFPSGVSAPVIQHVAPAMLIAFNSLRSGSA